MQLYQLVLYLFFVLAAFTTAFDEWRQELQMDHPSQRGAASMDTINRRFVLAFGFNECFDVSQGCDHTFYNDVWQYHVDFNTWYKGNPSGPKPKPRAFAASWHYVTHDSVLYFGGGRYNVTVSFHEFYNDMWEYFPGTDTWVQRVYTNAGPSKRLGPAMVILQDTAYVFGGIDDTFVYRNDLWSFDLDTNTWTLLRPDATPGNPGPRYAPSMQLRVKNSQSIKEIIIFGGNAPPPGSGNQWSDTWVYHIGSNTFTLVPSQPGNDVGRTHGASAFFGDRFIIALGDIKNDTLSCRTNEASGGQLPTNSTWYLNFRDQPDTVFQYKEADTRRAPRLKRVAYTQFEKKLWVWGGYDFVCPCGQFSGFPVWNTDLFYLDLEQLHD